MLCKSQYHSSLRKRPIVGPTQQGFTLIELLVVIVVIALLIAVAVPTFLNARDAAKVSDARTNVKIAYTAAKIFYTQDETYGSTANDDDLIDFIEATEPGIASKLVEIASDEAIAANNQIGVFANDQTLYIQQEAGDSETTNVSILEEDGVVTDSGFGGDNAGSGGGGGESVSLFQTPNTPAEWGTLTLIDIEGGTPRTNGGFLWWSRPGGLPTPDDWNTNANEWAYSIDGGAWQTWLPTYEGKIWGGLDVGAIMLPGADWIEGEPGLSGLSDGQQVQFRTPSGYYTDIITIINH